jgi:hypothetical protein
MRPLEALAKRGFLTDPMPESISAVSGFGILEGKMKTHLTLDIGIKIITHTRDGLKIIPTPCVVFAMTDDGGERFMDLFPSTVRELIPRLLEMCDAAEKIRPTP